MSFFLSRCPLCDTGENEKKVPYGVPTIQAGSDFGDWLTYRIKQPAIVIISADLGTKVLKTLAEFAQGNEGNKLEIATPSLSASINDIFWERWVGCEVVRE